MISLCGRSRVTAKPFGTEKAAASVLDSPYLSTQLGLSS
jgi:hypothetical protein